MDMITKNSLHERIKGLKLRAYNHAEKLTHLGQRADQSKLFIHSTANDEQANRDDLESASLATLSNQNETIRDNLEVLYDSLIDNDFNETELQQIAQKLDHYEKELNEVEQDYRL